MLSQLTGAVLGNGVLYFVTMTSVVTVLCLSANTSFADFPRLGRVLALDRYLPLQFAHPGRRLVYTTGIVLLSLMAGVLLLIFGGVTDRLIPLFAVGALIAFTMSQWGMVAHWRRVGGPHARRSLVLNGLGATATSVTALVVIVSKFTEGAWITVLIIPLFMLFFLAAHHSHERVDRAIMAEGTESQPLSLAGIKPPIVIVPLRRLDLIARKGLQFALSISPDVNGRPGSYRRSAGGRPVRDGDGRRSGRDSWTRPLKAAGYPPVTFVTLPSAYREFLTPFLSYVRGVAAAHPDRNVAVVIPEVVERRWYDVIFASHRPAILKAVLRLRGRTTSAGRRCAVAPGRRALRSRDIDRGTRLTSRRVARQRNVAVHKSGIDLSVSVIVS